MKWGLSLLMNLPEYYSTATLEIKQKMVGSIFPEKLVFEDGAYRTTRTNEVLALLCSNNMGLSQKEKRQEVISNNLPNLAPPSVLLSNQFKADLLKIYELKPFLDVPLI